MKTIIASFSVVVLFALICSGCSKKDEKAVSEEIPETTDYRNRFAGTYKCSGTFSIYSTAAPTVTKDTVMDVVVTLVEDSSVQFNLHRNPRAMVELNGEFSGYHFWGAFYGVDSVGIAYMDGGLGGGDYYSLVGKKIK